MAKYKYEKVETDYEDGKETKVTPRVYVPLGSDQLKDLDVDDTVEVRLKGRVVLVEERKTENTVKGEIRLELESSEVLSSKEQDAISEMID